MAALDVSARKLASALDVAPSTVQKLISGKSDISPEMAIWLAAVIGVSEPVWIGMQDAYDLWHASPQRTSHRQTKAPKVPSVNWM